MINTECGAYKIAHKNAGYIKKETIHPDAPEEFMLFYRWDPEDTDTVGQYKGEFRIKFIDTDEELIVPIGEDLYIDVRSSFTKMRIC
jgi:hypothetical protein